LQEWQHELHPWPHDFLQLLPNRQSNMPHFFLPQPLWQQLLQHESWQQESQQADSQQQLDS
jgi:hypothetical protein